MDPRGPGMKKVKAKALRCSLAADGVLVGAGEEEDGRPLLPVVPSGPYEGRTPGAPRQHTWKTFLLAASHNDTVSHHRHFRDMAKHLSQLVCWNPPEDLQRACKRWYDLCKLCTSVHGKAGAEGDLKLLRFSRPYFRVQMDFMEVKPAGQGGERYLLTVICTTTRYLFIRATATPRDAEEVASLLLDIFLDAGVIPAYVQSDNEFVAVVLEELVTLLGSNQIFSTALRPQS